MIRSSRLLPGLLMAAAMIWPWGLMILLFPMNPNEFSSPTRLQVAINVLFSTARTGAIMSAALTAGTHLVRKHYGRKKSGA